MRRPSAPGQSGLVRRLTSIAADRKSPHDGGAFHLQEFRSSTPWLARGLLGRAETANSPPRRWREQVAKFFVRDVSGNGRGLNRHALLRSLRAPAKKISPAGCGLSSGSRALGPRCAEQTAVHLQYAQRVRLDFFPVGDRDVGRIRWPHISIDIMKLTARPTS